MVSIGHYFVKKTLIRRLLLALMAFSSSAVLAATSYKAGIVTQQQLESAWQRMPEQALLIQLEKANQQQGSRWWWESPSFSLDYQAEDSPNSSLDSGLAAQWELGLELPIVLSLIHI